MLNFFLNKQEIVQRCVQEQIMINGQNKLILSDKVALQMNITEP